MSRPVSRAQSVAGIAFAALFLVAFFLVGADSPDYAAPDGEWTQWAADTESGNRVAVVLILLAAIAFLLFAGTLRRGLGDSPLTTTAVAGGLIGMTGIAGAIVLFGVAGLHGAASDPTVVRAVSETAGAGFLLAAAGFATLLGAAGALTLRARLLPRWTSFVAMAGAVALLLTFVTVLDENSDDSVFGIGFPLGFLCLVIWSIATTLNLRTSEVGSGREVEVALAG